MSSWQHRLSNKRPGEMLGDCAKCGPDTRLVRNGHGRFACSRARPWAGRRLVQEDRRLTREYGLTISDRDAMLLAQDGRCANPGCRTTVPGGTGTWHVDHDHEIGKVRALLCNTCNKALGFLGDGRVNDRIFGLYEYAVKHGPKLIGGSGAVFELRNPATT